MSVAAMTYAALLVALMAALWAGLLVLAEEAPTLVRALGDPPTAPGQAVPLYRAIEVGRLALLMVAGVSASYAVEWWLRPPLEAALTVAVTGALLYVLADALPRGAGVLLPQLAAAAARVARRSLAPFKPLIGLVAALERGLALLFPPQVRRDEPLGSDERDMLAGVVSLRDADVAEVMTPRLDVVAIDAEAEWGEMVDLLRRSEHARLPVYGDDLDDIVGVLYAKDLTPAVAGVEPRPERWQDLVRPAAFVPESKSLVAQLRDFQRGPTHMAIVVDEFGGTSGLLTLEDVLEEVVGEIHGEYDREEEPPVTSEGDDRFWVDGSVSLDTLSDALHVDIDHEEVTTVGGLIYSELGRVPRPGEELRVGEFRVVVEQVVRRRIRRVYFERRPEDAEAVSEEGA
jgi:CBS domain containing-hemolysin-like protein